MMQTISSYKENGVALYIVATPIGNLNEMTPRAIEILKNVDVIACEDTRTSMKLLRYFNINKKVISYHNFNEKESAEGILKLLNQNQNVALISDAGYPLLCDPGVTLTQLIIKNNYPVIPISGSNACLNALVASGISVHPFYFFGFLNSNITTRKKQLQQHKKLDCTLVYYESPHRIHKTLENMYEILGDRKVCIARELTKKHEQFIRFNLSEYTDLPELKGEIVVVVEKAQDDEIVLDEIYQELVNLVEQGISKSSAVKQIAKKYAISKNELYNMIHE